MSFDMFMKHVCFYHFLLIHGKPTCLESIDFSQDQNSFCLSSQAFACLQHGFLRNVENVYIYYFEPSKWCMGKCFCL